MKAAVSFSLRQRTQPQGLESLSAALQFMVEEAPGPSMLVDAGGAVISRNDMAAVWLDHSWLRERLERLALDVQIDGKPRTLELNGGELPQLCWQVMAWPMTDSAGRQCIWLTGADLTIKEQMVRALRDSRAMYKALAEASADFSWATDADGRFNFVSQGGAFGYEPWALNGRSALEFGEIAARCFNTREILPPTDVWLRSADGAMVCLSVSAVPVLDENGVWIGARGVGHDVTEDRLAQQRLEAMRRRDQLVRQILDAIRSEVTPSRMLERAVVAIRGALGADCCRLDWRFGRAETGAAADKAYRLVQCCSFRDAINAELVLARVAEPWQEEEADLLARIADHVAIAVEQSIQHEELQRLSLTDALTELNNRRAFEAEVTRRLAGLDRSGGCGVLMLIDVDHFKSLNDGFGHAAGDQALRRVADALRGVIRANDLAARIGGDEFAVWLDGAVAPKAERVAVVLRERLAGPPGVGVTLSIGMAARCEAGMMLERLAKRADAALYAVKRAGRNNARWYEMEGKA